MSVTVLQAIPFQLENYGRPPPPSELVAVKNDEDRPGPFDIWNAIQAQKAAAEPPAPFVPPPVRRSLSQTSLQICTESLGSENGSDDFLSPLLDAVATEEEENESHEREPEVLCPAPEQSEGNGRLTSVNYHCSGGRRWPPRSYPPPLLSMCRRDGRCLYMRAHRRDGRLVVEAVLAPSQNYLHAHRAHGRLLLSFIEAITSDDDAAAAVGIEQNHELEEKEEEMEAALEEEEVEAEEEEDEEEEEEEVEVVDRGTIVEVKVASMKVLRSSLVINKFVGCELPLSPPEYEASALDSDSSPAARWAPATTATAAAAVGVASSTLGAGAEACNEDGANGDDGCHQVLDNKLLFTSKRRNREELLRSMRRCSELRRPWFIWEPCCIATSY